MNKRYLATVAAVSSTTFSVIRLPIATHAWVVSTCSVRGEKKHFASAQSTKPWSTHRLFFSTDHSLSSIQESHDNDEKDEDDPDDDNKSGKDDDDYYDDDDDNDNFATSYHAPVMWKECIEALLTGSPERSSSMESEKKSKKKQRRREDVSPERTTTTTTTTTNGEMAPRFFVDGTLGGGGHSEALLRQLRPGDVLFGCDVDPDALTTASKRLAQYMPQPILDQTKHGGDQSQEPEQQEQQQEHNLPLFVPVRSNFCQLAKILPTVSHPLTGRPLLDQTSSLNRGIGQIDGILLDLGVSSFQIDTAERGFAFMKDGPLDMRLDGGGAGQDGFSSKTTSLSAAEVCNEFDVPELARILRTYGDEPRYKALATAIAKHRPLHTTGDLVQAVASVVPEYAKARRQGRTATLARVFQALRIFVNQEDKVLKQALEEMAPALLKPGGRLVVLSYHSMEDRMTKRVLRDGSILGARSTDQGERDIYGNYNGSPRPFQPAGKPIKATEEEIQNNSRARSATLRIGIRQ